MWKVLYAPSWPAPSPNSHCIALNNPSLCTCVDQAYDQCVISVITPAWLFGLRILCYNNSNFPSVP